MALGVASGVLTKIHVIPYGITVKTGFVPHHPKLKLLPTNPTSKQKSIRKTKENNKNPVLPSRRSSLRCPS